MRTITVSQFHAEIEAQGVANGHRDYAFKCPICHTVQSMNSLVKAGCPASKVDNYIGFSCEGRFTEAGPWEDTPKRRKVRGCDWTLGGLFKLHELEVVTSDGDKHPRFEIATPEEAQALAKEMANG